MQLVNDDEDDCGADELSEDEQIDDKPVNSEEKENHCTGANNKPVTAKKKKAKKKKKKGKTNDISKNKKDVSHHCLGKNLSDNFRVNITPAGGDMFIFNVNLNIYNIVEGRR